MKVVASLLGGLAGALVLNAIHESVRQVDSDAPRVDLVGEEAVNKMREAAGAEPLHGNSLYATALSADVLSNALYYSLIGLNSKHTVKTGLLTGAAAGVAALCLTEKVGLNDAPITRNTEAKLLTVAYYTVGGLAAACTIKFFRSIF